MHCPFLCRHLNKKRANQNQHSPQQQRNWLDELVFNYLDFVPLDPNTTPYYKKNTRNLRSPPKRVLPSWLQGPQHLNYKHDAHQVHNYGQSRNSVPLAQTEGQKYLFEKMEIQRAYRIVPPFSKQKNTTKIVKDEKVDERLEYKSKNLSTQAETVAWRLSAKSSHVIKSKSQLIKDDKNQLIVLDESKIKRPERLYYKPFSKRKSMEIKDIEAELKNYRRSASQKNMRLRLQEQQLIELYSLQNMAKPKKKSVKAKNLEGITNKWKEDIEKKVSKLTSTQQLIKDDKNQLIVIDESKVKRPERLYYKPFSKRKSMEIKDIEAELKNYRRSASQKNMRLRLQEQQLIELYSLQNMAKPKKKSVKAKNLEGITNKWKEDIEKKVSKLTSTQQLIKDDKNQLIVIDESKVKRPERLYYKPFSKRKSMEIKDIEAELKNYRRSASQKNMRLRLQEQQLIELYSLQNMAKPKKKSVKAKNLEGITNKWKEDIEKKVSKLTSTQQLIKDDKNQLIVIDESKVKRPERLYYKPFSKRKSMEIKDIEAELKNYRRSASQKNMRLRLQEQQLIELYSLQNMAKPKKKSVKAKNLEGITNKWKEDIEKKVSKLTSTQPSNGGRNFKISETSMNNESKPIATMRMVSEKKAMEIEYNIEDLLTDKIAKTPTIADYNIPSVKKKKRTQEKLFHLDVSVYPVKKSKKNHKLLAPKDYPNKVQNKKNKLNKLAAQAATKYIIKKMQRNNLANAPVGVPEQNKTNKGKSKAAIAAAKAPKETNKEQTIQENSSDDSIDKLIKSYSMRYIHNKNRISSSRRASAKSILKKISAVHKANEITKPKEINAQKENPIKVEANTTKVVQLNEKRTGSFTRKSIPSNRIDGRRSVRQSIKLQRLMDKRMEPRYKEYLKKLDEYDNEKLNKASESGAQLHSDKNLYKSLGSTTTIDNDLRSATSLSERFYESETTFSENQRHNAAERTKLENEIRELMKIVETRDELPVKKIQRNFVLEAQTQSWPTKRPRIEKAAKLKRFKLATKWEKIYLPESPKPIMLRRYCRKPPPRPPPPELPVVEPAKCACASRQHLELGKLEDDPPFIRDMKAAWQKLQLKNYYRFIIRRSALECQEPSQFENKCSHNQIICS